MLLHFRKLAVALPFLLAVTGGGSSMAAPAEAKFLLDGLKDSRDRLVTGIYRVTGRWVDDRPTEAVHNEGDVEVYCAFDCAEGTLRFDRSQVYPAEAAADADARRRASKYVRTPKDSLFYWDGRSIVDVHPPDWHDAACGTPFDVRLAGMGGWAEFVFAIQFETLHAAFMRDPIVSLSDDANGLRHLTWICGEKPEDRDVKRDLWLDETHGFAPIHLEIYYLDKTKEPAGWGKAVSSADSTWEVISGVWVPKTWAFWHREPTGRSTRYDLVFAWESVNEPVPADLFTAEGLSPPRGALVVTNELGKPIVREVIGMPGFEHPQSLPPGKASAPLRWRIVGGTGVVLLCIGTYFLMRGRRRARRAA